MNATVSRFPFVVGSAVVVAVAAFVVSVVVFREPQGLCMSAVTPGTVVTVRGSAMTSTYVPTSFTVPTGRSGLAIDLPNGQRAEGKLTVYDAKSPDMTFTEGGIGEEVQIDFCTFLEDNETYATEQDGVVTVYRAGSKRIEPTGFTLTRTEHDGVLAPANVKVSPNGVYVAYITWDATLGATVLGVAEVSGKNNTVLASLTPEQGEMALNELSWSGSKSVAYAEVTPMAEGPDENGNTREKTLYRIEVATHVREGVHIDPLP